MQRDNFLKDAVLFLHTWTLSSPNRALLRLQTCRTSACVSMMLSQHHLVLQQHRVPGTVSSAGLELPFCALLVALRWKYGLLQTTPEWFQTLQWILAEAQRTYIMQPEMIDDGMENIKEIPCHLVLLIVCWHDVLQIPVCAAFENRYKYWSLSLSLKDVNKFGRKGVTIIWPRSPMCREKERKLSFKVTCSCYLLTITASTVSCWQYLVCSTGYHYFPNEITWASIYITTLSASAILS